jgi:phenylalanyl-tRNA synthetase beta chain
MLISYDWLSDYVDLGDFSAGALAELLTMVGLEVDGIERRGSSLDGVVVGTVIGTRPHPNADRLTLCDVDLGEDAHVQIVCGAPNVAAGQKVPVAKIGTTLELPSKTDPSSVEALTLSRVKIRGEVSEGMICSSSELALGEDHSGIMVLGEDAATGQPLAAYLRKRGDVVADWTLDVAITPNRPDATSHIGMARDVAAVTGRELTRPAVEEWPAGESPTFAVRIEAPDACPRYVGLVVRNVRIGPSPAWLQRRLKAIGLRPINNVVDVTNYVMYEVGQPLHAFDLARLAGDSEYDAVIVVRQTTAEESFVTLDDQERTLPPGTLLICDADRPVAVAGVMGGANSEVTSETTDILIESAYFDPITIRQTARALGVQTDSSYRFERGADPAIQPWAATRAALLIAEIAGGEIEPALVDAHPQPPVPTEITLRTRRVTEVLGVDIPPGDIERLLSAIGFTTAPSDDGFRAVVPSFRPDIDREIDVIEEVARLYGYDRIPQPGRMALPSLPPRADRQRSFRAEAVNRLAGLGLRELYANSLIPAAVAERFAAPVVTGVTVEAVVTANPINRDMAALRPSLLPGLLAAVIYNQNRDAGPLRFFEIGHVFGRADEPDALVSGYRERESLIIGMSGAAVMSRWDGEAREVDFFDLKGIVTHLLEALGITQPEEIDDPTSDALTAYRLSLEVDGQRIGVLARLNDETAAGEGLRQPLFFAELDWTRLAALLDARPEPRYTPISRYPEVERDVAVTIDREQPVGPMLRTIRQAGIPLLREVNVFDLYEGERIEEGRKSVAFGLRFGTDRTLTDDVVDRQVRAIVSALESDHGAILRQ